MSAGAAAARKRFEMENAIEPATDADRLFAYDAAQQAAELAAAPWQHDPRHFRHVRVSALALLRMVMHARAGGELEVMGMMLGRVHGHTMYVLDAFALPVQGTETRVNAQAEGNEYMIAYLDAIRHVGRRENVVGWYHSHPGYGCWLSGIDVATQALQQRFQDPFLAVVIDPNRTVVAGKVDIGAFRTLPEESPGGTSSLEGARSIPLAKAADYGVHCNKYYPLDVSFFKSSTDAALLDRLWQKYWIQTLASSPLVANKHDTALRIADLAAKIVQADDAVAQTGRAGPLARVLKDSQGIARDVAHGLNLQLLKQVLFNCREPRVLAADAAGNVPGAMAPS
ncbi:hypothetical protein CXG81DRAFT_29805 [Caulochytrium protostelioides]|uniref:COP9 signalosome complex subunit 5 n=1 Tax=Caulochytrium protostelioides TaxID=1555241 RepID=A0A4P9X7K0_9FUNG|nr:hypothetical protein CXG81DRAFT_29805 [Caulochytrium protostelioides]|eukprot:RKP01227.1 hypothetical protein CXG81DRAFT_29805 [Caulochytrium protostelioides]